MNKLSRSSILALSLLLGLNAVDLDAKKQPKDFQKPTMYESLLYPEFDSLLGIHGHPKDFQREPVSPVTCGTFGPYDLESPKDLYRLGHDLADIRLPVLGSPDRTVSYLRQMARETPLTPMFSFALRWNPRANPNMGVETIVKQGSHGNNFVVTVGQGVLDCDRRRENCAYSLEIFGMGVSSVKANPYPWVNLNLPGMCLPLSKQP